MHNDILSVMVPGAPLDEVLSAAPKAEPKAEAEDSKTKRVDLKYPKEPIRIDSQEMNNILVWAEENDVSDVTFMSGQGVWVKQYSQRHMITNRSLSTSEIGEMLNYIYGANGTATINSAQDVDTSYMIKLNRDSSLRFRVNATSFTAEGTRGISITIRIIKAIPPTIEELDFDVALTEPFKRKQGMCLVTGETGSGKSTLLAAITRHLVEQPNANLSILTYESPIEYTQDEVYKPSSIVTPHEIPKDLKNFESSVRNAMRRNPDIINIGESRDAVTMSASIEASNTGHLLFTTLHSNGVSSTIRRAIAMFPEGERSSRALDIIESINIIITQRLVPSVDGKRVALREYLVFTEEIRDELIEAQVEKLPSLIRDLTRKHGQTLEMDARSKMEAGLITEREYSKIRALSRRMDDDSTFDIGGLRSESNHLGIDLEDLMNINQTFDPTAKVSQK